MISASESFAARAFISSDGVVEVFSKPVFDLLKSRNVELGNPESSVMQWNNHLAYRSYFVRARHEVSWRHDKFLQIFG